MINKPLLAIALAMVLPSLASAQQNVASGAPAKPAARELVPGMRSYYEPERVQREGDRVSFTLYRSAVPATPDALDKFQIDCQTREAAVVIEGQATQPARVLAGEALYPIGKKLCEWDPKGFFQRLLD
jgi:hypothetical protein